MIHFPAPETADENGLLAIGGNLAVTTLLEAYRQGIFPWPHAGLPLLWFCPQERGIVKFAEIHVPKSLQKIMKKNEFNFTFDKSFLDVIKGCSAALRPGQDSTWITPEMILAYQEFHKAGYAHSVECWKKNHLVGGLYGVWVDGVFMAESMFYKTPNASKLCLLHLMNHLKTFGHEWMDIQMLTPVTEALGGSYIPRDEFLRELKVAQSKFSHQSLHF